MTAEAALKRLRDEYDRILRFRRVVFLICTRPSCSRTAAVMAANLSGLPLPWPPPRSATGVARTAVDWVTMAERGRFRFPCRCGATNERTTTSLRALLAAAPAGALRIRL